MTTIRRILVVDDERQLVDSLLRHLWREGFTTDSATNGLEACRKLREASSAGTPFDLIIVDVVMPEMSGIELFKWVKKYQPLISTIFISAFGHTDAIRANIREGMDDYAQKPIKPVDLMKLIGAVERNRSVMERTGEISR
ncbi:MAG: response regulator [Syntrophobacteraceae bacterium]